MPTFLRLLEEHEESILLGVYFSSVQLSIRKIEGCQANKLHRESSVGYLILYF